MEPYANPTVAPIVARLRSEPILMLDRLNRAAITLVEREAEVLIALPLMAQPADGVREIAAKKSD